MELTRREFGKLALSLLLSSELRDLAASRLEQESSIFNWQWDLNACDPMSAQLSTQQVPQDSAYQYFPGIYNGAFGILEELQLGNEISITILAPSEGESFTHKPTQDEVQKLTEGILIACEQFIQAGGKIPAPNTFINAETGETKVTIPVIFIPGRQDGLSANGELSDLFVGSACKNGDGTYEIFKEEGEEIAIRATKLMIIVSPSSLYNLDEFPELLPFLKLVGTHEESHIFQSEFPRFLDIHRAYIGIDFEGFATYLGLKKNPDVTPNLPVFYRDFLHKEIDSKLKFASASINNGDLRYFSVSGQRDYGSMVIWAGLDEYLRKNTGLNENQVTLETTKVYLEINRRLTQFLSSLEGNKPDPSFNVIGKWINTFNEVVAEYFNITELAQVSAIYNTVQLESMRLIFDEEHFLGKIIDKTKLSKVSLITQDEFTADQVQDLKNVACLNNSNNITSIEINLDEDSYLGLQAIGINGDQFEFYTAKDGKILFNNGHEKIIIVSQSSFSRNLRHSSEIVMKINR